MAVIAFRADASLQIGTGHIMRCLTLADALRERGGNCSFVCRPDQGHLLDLIAQHGHKALALPEQQEGAQPRNNGPEHAHWLGTDWTTDAQYTQQALIAHTGAEPVDWLVVDHYALDARWEEALRPQAKRIMVIDDLADRPHTCDLLLDQNLGRSAQDYRGLLKGKTATLVGPKYALLRPEFAALRQQSLARRQNNSQLHRLLITMGGVDKDNATGQVLSALQCCTLPAELRLTVVMGTHAPWLAKVQAKAVEMPWQTQVLVGVSNMAELMAESDLCIGAAGSTSWERCCLGLPTLMLVLAANQIEAARAIESTNAAWTLKNSDFSSAKITKFFRKLSDGAVLTTASVAASCICDGGGSGRIVDVLLNSK